MWRGVWYCRTYRDLGATNRFDNQQDASGDVLAVPKREFPLMFPAASRVVARRSLGYSPEGCAVNTGPQSRLFERRSGEMGVGRGDANEFGCWRYFELTFSRNASKYWNAGSQCSGGVRDLRRRNTQEHRPLLPPYQAPRDSVVIEHCSRGFLGVVCGLNIKFSCC